MSCATLMTIGHLTFAHCFKGDIMYRLMVDIIVRDICDHLNHILLTYPHANFDTFGDRIGHF